MNSPASLSSGPDIGRQAIRDYCKRCGLPAPTDAELDAQFVNGEVKKPKEPVRLVTPPINDSNEDDSDEYWPYNTVVKWLTDNGIPVDMTREEYEGEVARRRGEAPTDTGTRREVEQNVEPVYTTPTSEVVSQLDTRSEEEQKPNPALVDPATLLASCLNGIVSGLEKRKSDIEKQSATSAREKRLLSEEISTLSKRLDWLAPSNSGPTKEQKIKIAERAVTMSLKALDSEIAVLTAKIKKGALWLIKAVADADAVPSALLECRDSLYAKWELRDELANQLDDLREAARTVADPVQKVLGKWEECQNIATTKAPPRFKPRLEELAKRYLSFPSPRFVQDAVSLGLLSGDAEYAQAVLDAERTRRQNVALAALKRRTQRSIERDAAKSQVFEAVASMPTGRNALTSLKGAILIGIFGFGLVGVLAFLLLPPRPIRQGPVSVVQYYLGPTLTVVSHSGAKPEPPYPPDSHTTIYHQRDSDPFVVLFANYAQITTTKGNKKSVVIVPATKLQYLRWLDPK